MAVNLRALVWLCPVLAAAGVGACGDDTSQTTTSPGNPASTGAGGASTSSSATGTGGLFTSSSGMQGPFEDFPPDPVIDASAPADAPTLFGDPNSGDPSGGPCLVEPEVGALFPKNWLRPRFRFVPASGQNLFEIRLHAENQTNDLVVYTASPLWTMPDDMWALLTTHTLDAPITMTVRGAVFDGTGLTSGPSLGSSGVFTIAPADAAGTIVYWTTSGGSSLKGFTVGDESVITALTPGQVDMPTADNTQVTCIGCHTSTPDGKFVGLTAQGPWGNAVASIEEATVGDAPPFMGPGGLAAFATLSPVGISTFSKAHWTNGDHVMVSALGDFAASELLWLDLEAQTAGEGSAHGFFARDGDPRGVGAPTWSHDGETIVYVSTDAQFTGRLDLGQADLYAVPYNDKAGGAAMPIDGAADPTFSEYYPSLSADDQWLTFNRCPSDATMYNQALAEVFVMPSSGGAPLRISANDPPACVNKPSPGITNSWPKWSPEAVTVNGKTYYWLIFSSTRAEAGNPQLYVTGVVVEGDTVTSYASLYLWNQPADENNHTPAWDVFQIPPVPPPE
jgi:WD40-like Beta Propeller Repeat